MDIIPEQLPLIGILINTFDNSPQPQSPLLNRIAQIHFLNTDLLLTVAQKHQWLCSLHHRAVAVLLLSLVYYILQLS